MKKTFHFSSMATPSRQRETAHWWCAGGQGGFIMIDELKKLRAILIKNNKTDNKEKL